MDNKCSVYEDRPLICNIDEGINHLDVTQEEFYRINYQECNKMMDEDGIDPSLRVGFDKKHDNEGE